MSLLVLEQAMAVLPQQKFWLPHS